MKAFPPVNRDGEMTADNIETMILRYISVANEYLGDHDAPEPAVQALRNSGRDVVLM